MYEVSNVARIILPMPTRSNSLIILIVTCFFLACCGGAYEPKSVKGMARCFEAEFGKLPPPGVTMLRAKQIIIGDAARAWLKFDAIPSEAEKLFKDFIPTEKDEFDDHSGSANTPLWFRNRIDETMKFYLKNGWNGKYLESTAVVAYDVKNQLVYFCHRAFD